MPVKDRSKRVLAGAAAAVGLTLGVAALAGAVTSPDNSAPSDPTREAPAAGADEIEDPVLNGSIQAAHNDTIGEDDEATALKALARISAADAERAALAAVPGGTVNGATALENENGSVVYAVEMTDAAGQPVDVKVDAGDGAVLRQETGDSEDEGKDSEVDGANEGPDANELPDGSEVSPVG